ncbi:uncharacterized protein BT62DRAFT_1001084 [Guyanagaster necrorhizus]|uniref:Uncharacterized protein n=1 Tax=Guyanagaster necrorhizus TaxID=856835 RepID=A0A9P8AWI5_9AGAR|nr:uncharacterized protein BT62DRAFT_1001084 [Guyanagaster necrorhizus MCA 3950]KAG7450231.1 hypothetical protein BT62DRAFT_1001084 [Guyanagaster necrorhizus MCA 3950]
MRSLVFPAPRLFSCTTKVSSLLRIQLPLDFRYAFSSTFITFNLLSFFILTRASTRISHRWTIPLHTLKF